MYRMSCWSPNHRYITFNILTLINILTLFANHFVECDEVVIALFWSNYKWHRRKLNERKRISGHWKWRWWCRFVHEVPKLVLHDQRKLYRTSKLLKSFYSSKITFRKHFIQCWIILKILFWNIRSQLRCRKRFFFLKKNSLPARRIGSGRFRS